MKMKVTIIFCILGLIATCYCATSILTNAQNPDYPGKCYYSKTDPPTIMKPGETVTLKGQCLRATCSDNFSVHFASCGVIGLAPNCKLSEEDLTKPYPGCCPVPICE